MKAITFPRLLTETSVRAIAVAATVAPINGGAVAQIVAVNNTAQVRTADNGVPVVDIAAPNAAGVSINQYDVFNVTVRGVVLNNSTSADANPDGRVLTQLAGLVDRNRQLTTAARTILNEVVSTNPSVLAGFMEVAGARADVIVANPNGITCGGCGVINTAAFTMTTGRSRQGGAGQLIGFDVTSGTLTINGNGLDARTTDYAALLGRKIAIGGPVFANSVDVIAGANSWDQIARTATPIAGTGATPD